MLEHKYVMNLSNIHRRNVVFYILAGLPCGIVVTFGMAPPEHACISTRFERNFADWYTLQLTAQTTCPHHPHPYMLYIFTHVLIQKTLNETSHHSEEIWLDPQHNTIGCPNFFASDANMHLCRCHHPSYTPCHSVGIHKVGVVCYHP